MARIVCFGEVLLRLASPAPGLILQEKRFEASVCGAEANVGAALAGFGHRCQMVTALPANPLGDAGFSVLREFGLLTEHAVRTDGRMGLYFLSTGAMSRPARIIYDRAGSSFARLDPQSFDWPTILEDADWLFTGGITAALGEGPLEALQDAIDCARSAGVKVAFDSNFRPALWAGREAHAAEILRDLALQADLLFAGRRAIAMMFGGRYDHEEPQAGFAAAAETAFGRSAALGHVAATRREVLSSDHHRLTALLASREEVAVTETIELAGIVDRIGTGDAFAAGTLHALIDGRPLDACAEFALAAAQWSHSIRGDFLCAGLEDIEHLRHGGGDVRR